MIGIVGASGAIGNELYLYLKDRGEEVIGTYFRTKKPGLFRVDLSHPDCSTFNACNTVVIMGGITNIDECARHKEEANAINVTGIIELIKYLADKRIKPVFISSDQVFNGKKGNYSESDEPDPVNLYGEFKLAVESFIEENLEDYLILRLSKTHSRNSDWGVLAEIVAKMRRGEKVRSAYNLIYNPTDVTLVCRGVHEAIKAGLRSIYHLADKKILSRYDFTITIAEEFGFDKELVEPVDMNTLPLLEKRALNSSLDVRKIFAALDLCDKSVLSI